MSASLKHCGISLVIPVRHDDARMRALLSELIPRLEEAREDFEVLLVDETDKVDGSVVSQQNLPRYFKWMTAQSWLEASRNARHRIIVGIDDDSRCSAYSVMRMVRMLRSDLADVIVSRGATGRSGRSTTKALGRRLLAGHDGDLRGSVKVFARETADRLHLQAPAAVRNLEFIRLAKDAALRVRSVPVQIAGPATHKKASADKHFFRKAIRLRSQASRAIPFSRSDAPASLDGFHFKSKAYTPHNTIPLAETAIRRLSAGQLFLFGAVMAVLAIGIGVNWHAVLALLVGLMTVLYFSDFMFNLLLVVRSFFFKDATHIDERRVPADYDWPRYTVFCPLYKEALILPQFTEAMQKIDYPKDKLEVMLLLEANDTETIEAAAAMNLPSFIKIVVVPHSMPKTKPKACNYGLRQATGEYAVIYDAEDVPDPEQLKKAVLAFRAAPASIGCIQAKLNYYNWDQNLLTRLFTLEYSLWYDLVLPGLQSIKAPIPLGGTSNHFRVADLRAFGGWDPFNVTEDADLGIRLAKHGYSTLILDSVTLEEANSQYRNWLRQRSRWIKGYIQTYFVHTRRLATRQSRRDFAIFQLVIGGKVLSALINPLLWSLTLLFFVSNGPTREFIHSLYPAPIFYLGLATLIMGNFLYMYYYMMGAAKRAHPELILYAWAVPLYWLMISIATFMAIYEFIVKPFHWQKTTHGLHLKLKAAKS